MPQGAVRYALLLADADPFAVERFDRLLEEVTTLRKECGFDHEAAMELTAEERLNWLTARARTVERNKGAGTTSEW